ncbi:hypothetical protein AJ78_01892 [Emergomyces pasteurianus Ep9510]|uniref:Uncharacterized protein n=1 Tax=Emergomyces pasteurianus Ep9510 TaxID=1447872 RepID=A0A1J9PPH7_9EURO|nr:hypothetical protein AJ78_01892 [Emergomyces pasteurianus Ep9510]
MSRMRTTTLGITSSKPSNAPRFIPPRQPFFVVHYTCENIPTQRAKKFSNDKHVNLYALRPKIEHMWATREKGNLWWSASTHGDITSEKSVIRSWCARRVRTAFTDALNERGYDRTGRRLPDIEWQESQRDAKPPSRLEALKGTLEINFRLAVKAAKYTDLVREAGLIVERIESYLKHLSEGRNDARDSSNR